MSSTWTRMDTIFVLLCLVFALIGGYMFDAYTQMDVIVTLLCFILAIVVIK